jgi:hypothetical protein
MTHFSPRILRLAALPFVALVVIAIASRGLRDNGENEQVVEQLLRQNQEFVSRFGHDAQLIRDPSSSSRFYPSRPEDAARGHYYYNVKHRGAQTRIRVQWEERNGTTNITRWTE